MSVARKVTVNAAALVLARGLTVVAGVATVTLGSRYLPLDEYGALITAVALVGLVEVATDLGVSTMAAREIARHPERERQIVGDVFGLSLATCVVTAVVGWGATQLIYAGPDDEAIRRAMSVLLVGLIAVGPVGAARAHFVANQRAYQVAIGETIFIVTAVGVTVVAVTAELGLVGVAAAQPGGKLVQAIAMTALMRPSLRPSIAVRPAGWRALFLLSLPLGGTLVINFLYFRLDAVLLSLMRDADDVALYGLAYKVVEALIVLPSYFMVTLLPEIARLEPRGDRLRGMMGQAVAVMEMIALPVAALTVALGDDIVTLVGGDKFEDSALALQILALGLATSFVTGAYGHALVAMGRQTRLFWQTSIVLLLNLLVNLAAIPAFGIYGAAAAVSASEIAGLVVARRLYSETAPLPRNPLRARMLLAGAIMLAALLLLTQWAAWEGVLALVAGGVIGLLLYGAALLALRAIPESVESQLLPSLLRRRTSEHAA